MLSYQYNFISSGTSFSVRKPCSYECYLSSSEKGLNGTIVDP